MKPLSSGLLLFARNGVTPQVEMLDEWLSLLSQTEKTLVLRMLLRRLTPSHSQFLLTALNHQVENNSIALASEIKLANNIAHVKTLSLQDEHLDSVLEATLELLPLLRGNNLPVAAVYLDLLTKCVCACTSKPYGPESRAFLDLCRDTLCLCVEHPAFSEDASQVRLEKLVQDLISYSSASQQNTTSSSNINNHAADDAARLSVSNSTFSKQQSDNTVNDQDHLQKRQALRPRREAPPLPPPLLQTPGPVPTLVQDLSPPSPSTSASSDPSLRASQLSLAPSSPTTQAPRNSASPDPSIERIPASLQLNSSTPQDFQNTKVKMWLKSLRLHKYSDIIEKFSYSELIGITDEDLEKHGIAAKGARAKMVKSIETLRMRNDATSEHLAKISAKELLLETFPEAVTELRELLGAPAPYDETPSTLDPALPSAVLVLLDSFMAFLNASYGNAKYLPSEELVSFVDLLDFLMKSPIFSVLQKDHIFTMKIACDKLQRQADASNPPANADQVRGRSDSLTQKKTPSQSSLNFPPTSIHSSTPNLSPNQGQNSSGLRVIKKRPVSASFADGFSGPAPAVPYRQPYGPPPPTSSMPALNRSVPANFNSRPPSFPVQPFFPDSRQQRSITHSTCYPPYPVHDQYFPPDAFSPPHLRDPPGFNQFVGDGKQPMLPPPQPQQLVHQQSHSLHNSLSDVHHPQKQILSPNTMSSPRASWNVDHFGSDSSLSSHNTSYTSQDWSPNPLSKPLGSEVYLEQQQQHPLAHPQQRSRLQHSQRGHSNGGVGDESHTDANFQFDVDEKQFYDMLTHGMNEASLSDLNNPGARNTANF